MLLVVLGCASEGPHYAISSSHARQDRDELILTRYWQRSAPLTFGMEYENRHEYFVAPLHDEKLGAAQRLERGDWGELALLFPVTGTGLYVRVLVGIDTIGFAQVAPGRATRNLDEAGLSRQTAWAVTRDGRHLLVIDPRGLRIIDTAATRTVERRERDTLVEVQRAIVEHFGSAGTWFVSNDLRHVVVKTPDWVYADAHSMTPEPVKFVVAGTDFTAGSDGLIYDRQTRSLSRFPLALNMPAAPIRYRIELKVADAHEGSVLLVYVGTKETGERVVVVASPDLAWQRVGEVPFRSRDLFALVGVEFRPERKQVRLLECAAPHQQPGGSGHAPDFYLHTWNFETNTTVVTPLVGSQIVSAIDQAKPR